MFYELIRDHIFKRDINGRYPLWYEFNYYSVPWIRPLSRISPPPIFTQSSCTGILSYKEAPPPALPTLAMKFSYVNA